MNSYEYFGDIHYSRLQHASINNLMTFTCLNGEAVVTEHKICLVDITQPLKNIYTRSVDQQHNHVAQHKLIKLINGVFLRAISHIL